MKRMKYSKDAKDYLMRLLPLYEAKKLQKYEEVQFFQDLIDTGIIWSLEDKYSKAANHLILSGKLLPPPSGHIPEVEALSGGVKLKKPLH